MYIPVDYGLRWSPNFYNSSILCCLESIIICTTRSWFDESLIGFRDFQETFTALLVGRTFNVWVILQSDKINKNFIELSWKIKKKMKLKSIIRNRRHQKYSLFIRLWLQYIGQIETKNVREILRIFLICRLLYVWVTL